MRERCHVTEFTWRGFKEKGMDKGGGEEGNWPVETREAEEKREDRDREGEREEKRDGQRIRERQTEGNIDNVHRRCS